MQKVRFDYFRGMEAEQYSFYRVPKMLFTAECFRTLSCEAKVLYGLMLDRMSLSIKNRWLDDEDRVYIVFTVKEAMEFLGCGKQKAVKSLAELDGEKGIGLIEKKRLGFGKPNVIYVKNFMLEEGMPVSDQPRPCQKTKEEEEKQEEEALEAGDRILAGMEKGVPEPPQPQSCGNPLPKGMKIKPSEVPKSNFKKYEKRTSRSSKIEL